MERSRLRNKYLKLKTNVSKLAYKKQRNYCVGLLRKVKKQFYENLNVNFVSDNKKFWKQIKSFFSDKKQSYNKITLVEKNEIISDPVKCAEIMNNFFSDSVRELGIDRVMHTDVTNTIDPVTRSVEKYKNHPSIIKLNSEHVTNLSFEFEPISESSTIKVILDMDSSKTYTKDNIPPKLLKANGDICSIIITPDLNRCIANGTFPINLKYADITSIFKKNDRLLKINYRPFSILPTVSKIYEKILYVQIYEYFNKIFSKYLCGFRTGHSTQHCLLFMLEKLNKALDKGLYTGILLTDLSKAFDSISHDLLIAKLNSYGFSKNSLNLMNDYLGGRKQRTKIGDNFSSYREIVYGVPQGSILGPLLFNIYINDLFLFSKDFNLANYADDCSPFEFSGTIDEVVKKLENDSCILIKWYDSNYLKPNPEKWHLVLSDTNQNMVINIANDKIANSSYEKILGIHFDNKLNFNTHVTKLCKRAGQKLHALARISHFMSLKKKKTFDECIHYITV